MGFFLCFSQIVSSTTIDDGFPMQKKMLEYLLKVKYFWTAVDNTQQNHPEAPLQRGHLI